jgi:NAD-dependent DNA ligase
MCKEPTVNLLMTPEAVVQRRLRIRLAICAYAYECLDEPLVPDHVYDEMSRRVDPSIETGHPVMDEFFRAAFEPNSGAWVRRHPEIDALERRTHQYLQWQQ